METCNIAEWVASVTDKNIVQLRQAIHTVFIAIAKSNKLAENMIVKGGVLLAIKYHSSRYTKDIDFSTAQMYSDFDLDKFRDELSESLLLSVEELPYGLDCKIQSTALSPKKGTLFPTLQISVGYAYQGTVNHKRLLANNCTDVLKIDYSFNERTEYEELIEISDGNTIKAYGLIDLVAEKYRAIIQQKTRKRKRRQDAYDIYWLLSNNMLDKVSKIYLMKSIIFKSEARDIEVSKNILSDDEIINCSKSDYDLLRQEIEGELPDFELVYNAVRYYFESFPWPN